MGLGGRFSEPPIHLLCRRLGYAFREYKAVVSPGDPFLSVICRILEEGGLERLRRRPPKSFFDLVAKMKKVAVRPGAENPRDIGFGSHPAGDTPLKGKEAELVPSVSPQTDTERPNPGGAKGTKDTYPPQGFPWVARPTSSLLSEVNYLDLKGTYDAAAASPAGVWPSPPVCSFVHFGLLLWPGYHRGFSLRAER